MQNATKISPDNAEIYFNQGNALSDLKRLDEAEASYRHALKFRPDFIEALYNLGSVQSEQGKLDEAEASYRYALEIWPSFVKARYSLGSVLSEQGKLDEAEASYKRVLKIWPNYADSYGNLGIILKKQGRLDDALTCFKQQLELTPENRIAQHYIASLTGTDTERVPIEYVESAFNSYADRFDTHLLQILKYEAPEKLVALITQHSTPPAEKWNALDLGCGTGLVGLAVAPFARQLVGVDLSAKMLEKARARNLYQRLEHLDLLEMMRGEETSSYDVIIAADVFIYLGKLDEIISELKRLLCPDGFFAFSIETTGTSSIKEAGQSAQRDYQLENTGRFSHSPEYITKLAFANNFLALGMVATQIRMEHDRPINGYLALWKNN